MQNFMERLRPLVGLKSWDYCVLWILSEDQRFIEWVDCCCSGADEHNNNGGGGGGEGGEVFHVSSSNVGCRDAMFQHPKTKACDLLFQLPSSLPLDSGNHAETLFSNQYRWLNFSNSSSDSSTKEETIGTRVLIPITGGLVELYVANQVAEDQNVVDFITTQCSIISLGHEQEAAAMINSNNTNMDINQLQSDHQEPPLSPTTTASQNPYHHLPYDISVDRIHLCSSSNNTSSSPMNFPQLLISFSSSINNQTDRNGFFYDGGGSNGLFQGNHMDALQNSMITDTSNLHHNNNNLNIMDHHQPMILNDGQEQEAGNDEKADSVKQETGGSDSDCSDQVDDNDGNTKYRRRNGKAPPAKNLMAERKRRKKLQDRLYALRALVPKITKLDKAAILGDAIDFVQELQKQAKDLQDELEENSDDESDVKNSAVGGLNHHENNHDNINNVHHQSEFLNQQNGGVHLHLVAPDNNPSSKQNHHDSNTTNDKGQQMEPQVEVAQLDGNEFFVKVFCEHKAGGFVRLLEALNTLGLEVTNANVTSFLSLVSNVFVVEKRDSGMVGADHVRDSLLELTRNPKRTHHCPEDNPWKNSDNPTTTPNAMDYHHHHHHHLHNHNHHIGSHHHLQN